MVNNRGPRADPWKTPMVLERGLETTLSLEGEEIQTDLTGEVGGKPVRVNTVQLELGS